MRDKMRISLGKYLSDQIKLENLLLKTVNQDLQDLESSEDDELCGFFGQVAEDLDFTGNGLSNRRQYMKGGVFSSTIKMRLEQLYDLGQSFWENDRLRFKKSIMLKMLSSRLNLVAVNYTMLHAIAFALKDEETAVLALKNLKTITPHIIRISELLPEVVARELSKCLPDIDPEAGLIASQACHQAWNHQQIALVAQQ